MMWTVRLRSHEPPDVGRILETATYSTPDAAMAAYRMLLARDDLTGQRLAAVLKPPRAMTTVNTSTYFSRFDREIGDGRIHPDDPRLDALASREAADLIANTPPPAGEAGHDYEADPRPFSEIAKSWARTVRATRAQAADLLGVSVRTYNKWCDGSRVPDLEIAIRRLMTYITRERA